VTAVATAERRLIEGSEAMADAAIAAGCRFFAGYPMTPFTELLEHLAKKLPETGGVCINAESELEAVGMAWGALATGARAATGSTGQGLSLMQESFSEITLAELPLVVFNMARGQQDYFQATRGGGHGDYRHIVLAPLDISEAVELTQLAFHLADKWRNPVLLYGDYLLAHTYEAVAVEPIAFPELPSKSWAVDGSAGGTGDSRLVTPLGLGKHGHEAPGIERHLRQITDKLGDIEREEQRVETAFCDDAEAVVVAFGTSASCARSACGRTRTPRWRKPRTARGL
jgi:2-oxoglutarate/2-oxoacid ferredoxin oxidoreductase subunit alpha